MHSSFRQYCRRCREVGLGRENRLTTDTKTTGPTAANGPRSSSTGAPLPNVGPLKVSPVYDTYWRFAVERQQVEVGLPLPIIPFKTAVRRASRLLQQLPQPAEIVFLPSLLG